MTLNRIISLSGLLLIAGYLGFHVYGLIAPPPLQVTSPPSGLTTSSKTIAIKGKTLPGAKVEVNGNPLVSDRSGEFGQTLVLGGGIHTLTISARKRYSRPATAVRQILILDGPRVSTSAHGGI
ncbi:hypothetical protein HYW17_02725 [Candidatus Uhrbacteria bacterium]|nr:hypothetical protein [Candidatus Uhrbacteria bacterium]